LKITNYETAIKQVQNTIEALEGDGFNTENDIQAINTIKNHVKSLEADIKSLNNELEYQCGG